MDPSLSLEWINLQTLRDSDFGVQIECKTYQPKMPIYIKMGQIKWRIFKISALLPIYRIAEATNFKSGELATHSTIQKCKIRTVYTKFNGNIYWVTHRKQQKSSKATLLSSRLWWWIISPFIIFAVSDALLSTCRHKKLQFFLHL